MKRYLVILFVVSLIDQLMAPRPPHAEAPRVAAPQHHFYMRCDVTWQRCRVT
jgi:hypothetical protein